MGRSLLDRDAGFLLEQRRRKRWQKAVCGMAAVVVFCTTYALILPAITMSSDTICGISCSKKKLRVVRTQRRIMNTLDFF